MSKKKSEPKAQKDQLEDVRCAINDYFLSLGCNLIELGNLSP